VAAGSLTTISMARHLKGGREGVIGASLLVSVRA